LVFSYYLTKYPYRLVWHLLRWAQCNPKAVVYLAEPLDHVVLAPILRHLPPMPMVAKNRRTIRYLRRQGLTCRHAPSFPQAVITCRHAAHRFPSDQIVKIGFRHGAYHFKAFAKPRYYQAFDAYGVTSEAEVALLRDRGVRCAIAVGFPKIDPAFDGSLTAEMLESFRQKAGIDPQKQTVLFTATWDGSGLSAVERWIDRLPDLTPIYNVLVTLHPWTKGRYREVLQQMPGVHFIDSIETLPYLVLADVMVGDYSSIIAEFCALDKPMVLFRLPETDRSVPEVNRLLEEIALCIDQGKDLREALRSSLQNPATRQAERQRANRLMFGPLDGRAGERAAELITRVLQSRGIDIKNSIP